MFRLESGFRQDYTVLTLLGTFRHITEFPFYGLISSVTPWSIQTYSSWIAAVIATISDLVINLSSEHLVHMRVL